MTPKLQVAERNDVVLARSVSLIISSLGAYLEALAARNEPAALIFDALDGGRVRRPRIMR